MADQKSKLPDFSEITSMAGKFFTDIKTSISQIIEEYKTKHPKSDVAEKSSPTTTTTSEIKVETKVEEPLKAAKIKEPVKETVAEKNVVEEKVVVENVKKADESKK
ncbi:MAG: hypothetical protein Q8R24_00120 [Legionellaceae bacterium]|nr:hypothetical protein [Legionellaceae bacterium]